MGDSTKHWAYYNPVRIIAGVGAFSQLPDLLPAGNVLLVTTPGSTRRGMTARVKALVGERRVIVHDKVTSNPGLDDLESATSKIKAKEIRSIIALGGGSAIDTGKVLSVTLPLDISQPLHHVLRNGYEHAWSDNLQVIAIPTTAGSGSEVTPFATVWDHDKRKKYSISSRALFAHCAIVDPELTHTLPTETTCHAGLDAINQAAESIWNKNATPLTIALAMQALQFGLHALPRLVEGGVGDAERNQMSLCSLFSGLAISQTRTALCHSISYPITAHFGVPHGFACAFTMCEVLRLNMTADDGRFELLKLHLGVTCLQRTFRELCDKLRVREQVRKYVVNLEKLLALVDEMYAPERADNNLAQVNSKLIFEIVRSSW